MLEKQNKTENKQKNHAEQKQLQKFVCLLFCQTALTWVMLLEKFNEIINCCCVSLMHLLRLTSKKKTHMPLQVLDHGRRPSNFLHGDLFVL